MEVLTIISFSSPQRTVEQNVGIPVIGGSGAGGEVFPVFSQDRIIQ